MTVDLNTVPLIERFTERDMLDRLNIYYGQRRSGNGQRFVGCEHVRSHAGFDAIRTADYVAMDLWPSKGLALHGHEVKVSRSDWLTELKHPEKADQFRRYMDYWWLVVSDPGIVRGDLPLGWGLMVRRDDMVQIWTPAKRNPAPLPLPRTFMACLLRSAVNPVRAGYGFAPEGPAGAAHRRVARRRRDRGETRTT